jgi:hypothetical protein
MNALLTRLGVSPEIQAFFNASDELTFNYGDTDEHYGDCFHKVPTSQNLWVAGNETASDVIVTYSAMEAIAFITIHRQRYAKLEQLAFIAVGNRLHAEQVNWIRQNFRKRRFTLVFGKDLLGHITDIKLAAGLKNFDIRMFHAYQKVMIYRKDQLHIFNNELLSLHTFQQAFGLRSRIRTRKPTQSLTFLDQLKYDAER